MDTVTALADPPKFDCDAYRAERAARPLHVKQAEFLGELAKALFPYGREGEPVELTALRMDVLAFAAYRCARTPEGV